MNKIIIELCAEDRARLDAIIAELKAINSPLPVKQAPAEAQSANVSEEKPQAKEMVKTEEKIEEAPDCAAEHALAEQPAPEPTAQKYTTSDLQQKVVRLCAAGKKEQARTIVNKYATSVREIPADKIDEAMEQLLKLEG